MILVSATALYGWLGNESVETTSLAQNAAILGLIFLKVRLVMREFMGARGAPRLLQVACDAWLFLTVAALAGFIWAPVVGTCGI